MLLAKLVRLCESHDFSTIVLLKGGISLGKVREGSEILPFQPLGVPLYHTSKTNLFVFFGQAGQSNIIG